jgi:glycosidase
VWEDASNKISYSQRRRYLQGAQLDSVMNYPFADALINFAISGVAEGFNDRIQEICENYPKPAVDCLMNHIGTHDTCRVLSKLATLGSDNSSHLERYKGGLSDEQKAYGKTLLRLISTMQFTLPGVPCIYYGDEFGMEGYHDPFNRKTFPTGAFNDKNIDFFKKVNAVRNGEALFKSTELSASVLQEGVAHIVRTNGSAKLHILANMSDNEYTANGINGFDLMTDENIENTLTLASKQVRIIKEGK